MALVVGVPETVHVFVSSILIVLFVRPHFADVGDHTNGYSDALPTLKAKDRTYSMSRSLSFRVHVAIGVHSVGLFEYWFTVLKRLGVVLSNNTLEYLDRMVCRVERKRKYQKTRERKAKRQKHINDKIIEQLKQQTADAAKGMNYGSGIGIEDQEQPAPRTKRPKRPKGAAVICELCGLGGHTTARSRLCLNHVPKLKTKMPLESMTAEGKEQGTETSMTVGGKEQGTKKAPPASEAAGGESISSPSSSSDKGDFRCCSLVCLLSVRFPNAAGPCMDILDLVY